jgi:hypothetical protein
MKSASLITVGEGRLPSLIVRPWAVGRAVHGGQWKRRSSVPSRRNFGTRKGCIRPASEEVFTKRRDADLGELFLSHRVDDEKERCPMTSKAICFLLGTVFPLAMVGWLLVQG